MDIQSELHQLARDLISIESITGNEKPMSDFLQSYLTQRGWVVELQDVESSRQNVFAYRKGHAKPRVLINSHIDTVPPYFPLSEDDEYFYGRGACDTKGLIASQLIAAQELVESGFEDIGLLYVVGEEVDHIGIKKANELELNPEFFVCAEPTDLKLAIRQKGMYRVQITAKGKLAHSGYPEAGESAIHKLLPVLVEIIESEWPEGEAIGKTTVNIGLLNGGVAGNVLADKCSAEVVFRVADEIDEIENKLKSIVADKAHIDILVKSEPYSMGIQNGFETTVVSFHTDIPHFEFSGQAFLIGAGSILDAHTEHEKVAKADLIEMVNSYKQLIEKLLG